MIKYSKEQADFLLNSRKQFNATQAALGVNHLVGNASPLPRYVWEMIDRDAVQVQRDVLAVYNDLASSVSMAIPIGKLLHMFPKISDSGSANVSLDGRGKNKSDSPLVDYAGTPIPIIDDVVQYGWRQVAAAESEGYGNFTDSGIQNSQRKVAEKLEDIVLNGDSSIVVGGSTLYGLRNHPNRNTGTHGLTLNASTGAQWLTALKTGLGKLQGDNFFTNTVTVYLNWQDWFYASTTDYTANYAKTILQRLQEVAGVTFVPASKVPANEMLFVVKQRSVVTLLNGMPLSTRAQVRSNPEDDYKFVTMAASALEIRTDYDGRCGISHLTTA